MAGPRYIKPSPIAAIAPVAPSAFWASDNSSPADRPLNVIGFQNEYDEIESRVELQEESRQRAAEYHRRALRARELAAKADPYKHAKIGRIIQHDNSDYVGFRYTATTPSDLNGTPFDPNSTTGYAFDRIIWEHSNIDGLGNPQNVSNYGGYAAMRMNIAVLRNIIYNQYFPDGKYDPEDKNDREKYDKIREMARFLGEAIKDGTFVKMTTGSDSLAGAAAMPVNEANRPDYGAKAMYQFLLERQSTHMGLPVNGLFATPAYAWDLQPINETALSDSALQSFFNTTEDLHDVMERLHDHLAGHAESMKDTAIRAANALARPEDLPAPTQAIAIAEARNILDKFKGVFAAAERGKDGKNAGAPIDHEVFLPMEAVSLANYANQLGQIYLRNVAVLMRAGGMDAEMQGVHANAVQALGQLSWAVRNQSLTALTRDESDPLANEKLDYLANHFGLDGVGNPLPEAWTDVRSLPPHAMLKMISQVETGLEEINTRLRSHMQEQSSSGISRGNELGGGMALGGNSAPGGMNLPQHLINSTLFHDAAMHIRSNAAAGSELKREFDSKSKEKKEATRKAVNPNDLDGNGIDDRQQASLQPQPGQQMVTPSPTNTQPQQAAQQQQGQRPKDPAREQQKAAQRQMQQAQQARQAAKIAERQVRATQANPNAQQPKAVSMFNSLTAQVNKLINRKQQNVIVSPQNPKFTTASTQMPSFTTTSSAPSTRPNSAAKLETISNQPQAPAVFDPSAPGAYLPPKPDANKTRGV